MAGGKEISKNLAATLSQFEQLELRRQFSERMYGFARDGVERARIAAERQQIYLATFAPPSLPQDYSYPAAGDRLHPDLARLLHGLDLRGDDRRLDQGSPALGARSHVSRACLVLAPEVDVERADGGFNALGPEPWLGLSGPSLVHLAGRFVTLTYAASLWDAPARPVIRFWRRDGPPIDRIAAAPVAGCGTWTGRIPPETTRVSISPTHHSGRFDFEVLACRRRRWPLLLVEGVFKRPRSTRSAVLTKLIGWAPESDVNLAWAIGATPLHGFPAWWRARSRPADPRGPRSPALRLERGAANHAHRAGERRRAGAGRDAAILAGTGVPALGRPRARRAPAGRPGRPARHVPIQP